MRIDLGNGMYLEPDDPQDKRWRRRIVKTEPLPDTASGHYADLECGHGVMIFGNLAMIGEDALCQHCQMRTCEELQAAVKSIQFATPQGEWTEEEKLARVALHQACNELVDEMRKALKHGRTGDALEIARKLTKLGVCDDAG